MLTLFIIVAVLAVAWFLLRRPRTQEAREEQPPAPAGSGFGGMLGGGVLGYLLAQQMITHAQYDQWRNLDEAGLKAALTENGVVSGREFDALASQAAAGELALPDTDGDFGQDDFDAFGGDGGFDG